MSIKPQSVFLVLAGLVAAFFIVVGLGNAVMPLLLAFFLAYLTFPLILYFEQKGLPRAASVSLVFVAIFLLSIGVLALVIPLLFQEARSFFRDLPQITDAAFSRIEMLGARFGFEINLARDSVRELVLEHTKDFSLQKLKPLGLVLQKGVAGILGSILALLNLFLFPLFFFYVVLDYENIVKEIRTLTPSHLREGFLRFEAKCNDVLSGYIRGQILVALILATLYATGLGFTGIKFGILIGIIAGLLNIIPYVGFAVGFTSAILVCLADYGGVFQLLGVVSVFAVVQVLEGFYITPKLVGDKVGLSAFVTILALIIGGNLFGFLGVLIAIPVAAILKHIALELRAMYLQSDLY